ncbi:hypothetical protein B9Z55_015170 [Caenorhabditis nigoni]|uniref:protein-serine/threonine phosphatase n=1 Tax=Caenorhabditis nigoni TaxID=1611254 RepID=A0A2G5U905_9PELO|nr:hypothetical protein B9Z55_015170 [Caenorhabditis nigoni]
MEDREARDAAKKERTLNNLLPVVVEELRTYGYIVDLVAVRQDLKDGKIQLEPVVTELLNKRKESIDALKSGKLAGLSNDLEGLAKKVEESCGVQGENCRELDKVDEGIKNIAKIDASALKNYGEVLKKGSSLDVLSIVKTSWPAGIEQKVDVMKTLLSKTTKNMTSDEKNQLTGDLSRNPGEIITLIGKFDVKFSPEQVEVLKGDKVKEALRNANPSFSTFASQQLNFEFIHERLTDLEKITNGMKTHLSDDFYESMKSKISAFRDIVGREYLSVEERTVMPGFPDGSENLKNAALGMKSDFIKRVVTSDRGRSFLKTLESFGEDLMKELQPFLDPTVPKMSPSESLKITDNFMNTLESARKETSNFDKIGPFTECVEKLQKFAKSVKVNDWSSEFYSIEAVKDKLQSYAKEFNQITLATVELKNFQQKVSGEKILEKFDKYQDKEKLIKELEGWETQFKKVETTELARWRKSTNIDELVDENRNWLRENDVGSVLKCLQDTAMINDAKKLIEKDQSELSALISLQPTDATTSKVIAMVAHEEKVANAWTSKFNSPEKMKITGIDSPWSDPRKVSTDFNRSLRIHSDLVEIVKNKDLFNRLLASVKEMKDSIEKHGGPDKNKRLAVIDKFVNYVKNLQNLIKAGDSIQVAPPTDLKSYEPFFPQNLNFSSYDQIEFKEFVDILQKVNSSFPTPEDADVLRPLGLNFVNGDNYLVLGWNAMSSTIAFFVTMTGAPFIQQQLSGSYLSTTVMTIDESTGLPYWVWILIGLGVPFSVALFLGYLRYRHLKKKANKGYNKLQNGKQNMKPSKESNFGLDNKADVHYLYNQRRDPDETEYERLKDPVARKPFELDKKKAKDLKKQIRKQLKLAAETIRKIEQLEEERRKIDAIYDKVDADTLVDWVWPDISEEEIRESMKGRVGQLSEEEMKAYENAVVDIRPPGLTFYCGVGREIFEERMTDLLEDKENATHLINSLVDSLCNGKMNTKQDIHNELLETSSRVRRTYEELAQPREKGGAERVLDSCASLYNTVDSACDSVYVGIVNCFNCFKSSKKDEEEDCERLLGKGDNLDDLEKGIRTTKSKETKKEPNLETEESSEDDGSLLDSEEEEEEEEDEENFDESDKKTLNQIGVDPAKFEAALDQTNIPNIDELLALLKAGIYPNKKVDPVSSAGEPGFFGRLWGSLSRAVAGGERRPKTEEEANLVGEYNLEDMDALELVGWHKKRACYHDKYKSVDKSKLEKKWFDGPIRDENGEIDYVKLLTQMMKPKFISRNVVKHKPKPIENRDQIPKYHYHLRFDDLVPIVLKATELFKEDPAVLRLNRPIIINVTDIHGRYRDCLWNFISYIRDKKVTILFSGDVVDRGPRSMDCFLMMCLMKICYPNNFYYARGNHETNGVNAFYGFLEECAFNLGFDDGTKFWMLANYLCNELPVASILQNAVLSVHGGIAKEMVDFEGLQKLIDEILKRPTTHLQAKLNKNFMWSDVEHSYPVIFDGVAMEFFERAGRGGEFVDLFTPYAAANVLKKLRLKLIVRGHQVMPTGIEVSVNFSVVTAYSSTCNNGNNMGCHLIITPDLVVVPIRFINDVDKPYGDGRTDEQKEYDSVRRQLPEGWVPNPPKTHRQVTGNSVGKPPANKGKNKAKKSVEKQTAKTKNKSSGSSVAKKAAKTTDKQADSSIDDTATTSTSKPIDVAADEAGKSVDKSIDKSVGKSVDNSTDESADKTAIGL